MIYSVDYYRNMIDSYDIQDLVSCNYDYYQHSINLRCYLSELYKKINSEFDITKDDISVIDFVNYKLNEVKKNTIGFFSFIIFSSLF